jgi:FlaA1/EpsC-like NDP-sugar epimerase
MNVRRLTALLHDVIVAGLAWILAFWLRFNLDIPDLYQSIMLTRLPGVVLIHVVIFWGLGLYRGLWRYASLPDLQRIVIAVGLGAALVPAVFALLRVGTPVPRSVYLITPLLLGSAMCASRLFYRAWKEGRLLTLISAPNASPVLVLGAGKAAAALISELAASQQWRVGRA